MSFVNSILFKSIVGFIVSTLIITVSYYPLVTIEKTRRPFYLSNLTDSCHGKVPIAHYKSSLNEVKQDPVTCFPSDLNYNRFGIELQKTPPLLPSLKNPCWKGTNDETLCVPYVYLTGFPKCGTTSLHYHLMSHPMIVRVKTKEPHFITRRLHSMYLSTNNTICRDDKMRTEYTRECTAGGLKAANTSCEVLNYSRRYFGNVLSESKRPKFGRLKGINTGHQENATFRAIQSALMNQRIAIDSSASTAWDNIFWTEFQKKHLNCKNIIAFNPEFVSRINPNARLIMILRDPVERAYSDFAYFKKKRKPEYFNEETVRFTAAFRECERENSTRDCVYLMQSRWTHGRHAVGFYHVYIADWLEKFPRENLHIIKSEDYKSDTKGTLQRMFAFLGFPELTDSTLTEIAESTGTKSNENSHKTDLGPMDDGTRKLLQELYAPHNQKLADLLQDENFNWKYM